MMNPPMLYLPAVRWQLAWERICEAGREGRKPRFLTFRCLLTAHHKQPRHATSPSSPCRASHSLDRPTDHERPLAGGAAAVAAVALPEFLNHRRKEEKKEEIKIWKDSLAPPLGSLLTAPAFLPRCCLSVG